MENQRIRISKTMLKEALLKLLQKKDLSRITVAQLCETAQINRTTFYKYYSTTYDLLAEIEGDFFEELGQQFAKRDLSERDMLSETVTYLDKDRDKMKILLNALSCDSFYDHLMQQAFIHAFLDQIIPQADSPSETNYIKLFFSRGIYAILRDWLFNEKPESPEELVELILSIRKRFED